MGMEARWTIVAAGTVVGVRLLIVEMCEGRGERGVVV